MRPVGSRCRLSVPVSGARLSGGESYLVRWRGRSGKSVRWGSRPRRGRNIGSPAGWGSFYLTRAGKNPGSLGEPTASGRNPVRTLSRGRVQGPRSKVTGEESNPLTSGPSPAVGRRDERRRDRGVQGPRSRIQRVAILTLDFGPGGFGPRTGTGHIGTGNAGPEYRARGQEWGRDRMALT